MELLLFVAGSLGIAIGTFAWMLFRPLEPLAYAWGILTCLVLLWSVVGIGWFIGEALGALP